MTGGATHRWGRADTFRRRGALGWNDDVNCHCRGVGPNKHLAYAYIMMADGLPMVFYPDYFNGIVQASSDGGSGFAGGTISNYLTRLIWARSNFIDGASTTYRATNAVTDLFIMERSGGAKDGCLLAINDNPSGGSLHNNVEVHWSAGTTLINVLDPSDTVSVSGSPPMAGVTVGPRTNKVYVNQALYGSGPHP